MTDSSTSLHTQKEIAQQPDMWQATLTLIEAFRPQVQHHLHNLSVHGMPDVLFLGAGTSEYVGNILEKALVPQKNYRARSVATTDILSAPQNYLRNVPTLAVSFGRSGDSPESIGALSAIQAVNPAVFHLIITCNAQGQLAKLGQSWDNALVIVLPEATHDQGFAMTSSFTSMTLAAYGVLSDVPFSAVAQLIEVTRQNLGRFETLATSLAELTIDRYVVLASHALKGFAQESQLKMLELTAGRLATQFDTPMGFRHGPKSFLTSTTLTVVMRHPDPLVQRYEQDLVNELVRQGKTTVLVLGNTPQNDVVSIDIPAFTQDDVLWGLAWMPLLQWIALKRSIALGIHPDNPSPSGEVNRVVSGVTLYPVEVA